MEHFDKAELCRLFEAAYAQNKEHHLFLVTVFWSGSRVSETLELTGADVRGGRITIRRKKGSLTTTQDVHTESDPLFDGSPIIEQARKAGAGRMFRFNRQRVDQFIKAYAAKAGIDPKKAHCHAIKHSTALTLWKQSDGNIGLLQRHLGHKAASSSLQYLYQVDAQKACDIMGAVRMREVCA
jgi:integrase